MPERQLVGILQWRHASDYHMVSECGRFTVAKLFTGGAATYDAWRIDRPRKLGFERWLKLGCPDAEAAKAICEAAL